MSGFYRMHSEKVAKIKQWISSEIKISGNYNEIKNRHVRLVTPHFQERVVTASVSLFDSILALQLLEMHGEIFQQ